MEVDPRGKKEKKKEKSLFEVLTENDEEAKEFRRKRENTLKLTKPYFVEARFLNELLLEPHQVAKWRMKQRMRTVSVALVLCLNIGVDPPDVIKTSPCARLECWIDPTVSGPQKALDQIGKTLQQQYERWQPRAKYKKNLDPTVDDVKKLCMSLRRNAKEERVLFHYNGHGVPKPTNNGEIWVFNKNYTQYIPLSIYELQGWVGSPSIYVFDCSSAGLIVTWFNRFVEQRDRELEPRNPISAPIKDYILLAACEADELLPMNPELPADVFTSCLTTPIKIALQWHVSKFCSHSAVVRGVTPELIDKLPGRPADRKTPLGELNWIFTAVTDTIAWNVLPKDLFQRLFRQDLLVASLFRNFLLAERIMRSANCTPVSYPALPPTYQHPMWQAWDLAADICLSQLTALTADPTLEYHSSPFFTEQLTAFQVWLEFGSEKKRPPEQLPIVLQVLLSQAHRLRALELLAKFLDLGPWAVNLALSVGIFPYVLKLLQSPAIELRPTLVFIWAKILALDKSCQLDLVKDCGHNYFISILASNSVPFDQRTLAAFVLAAVVDNCRPGQSAGLAGKLISICLSAIEEPYPSLRKWVTLCLAKLWEDFDEAKWVAVREQAHQRLCVLLTDPVPEVRAAAVYALGTFIGGAADSEQRKIIELNIAVTLPVVTADGSPLVRKELIIALSKLVNGYADNCKEVAIEMREEARREGMEKEAEKKLKKEQKKKRKSVAPLEPEPIPTPPSPNPVTSSVYGWLWKMVLLLTTDPYPPVSEVAETIVETMNKRIQASELPEESKSASVNFIRRTTFSLGIQSSPRTPNRTREKVPTGSNMKKTTSTDDLQNINQPATVTTPQQPETPTGTSVEQTEEDRLDISSDMYEWSWHHMSLPSAEGGIPCLSTHTEPDLTHPSYQQRLWRLEKHKMLLKDAKMNISKTQKLDQQIAILDNESEMASLLQFHPLEDWLIVADNKDGICVWNYLESRKISSFKNDSDTRVSAIALINPYDESLLLTGNAAGVVKVWKNYTDETPELVTAWKALPDLPSRPGPGMVINWHQQHGKLFTSGDIGFIRLWDMDRELAVQDILSGSDSCVTSIAHQAANGHIVVAGCGDGSVRIFDCRTHSKYSPVITYQEHKKWVVNVAMTYLDNQIISGSVGGEIKFWDTRKTVSSKTIATRHDISSLTVHPFHPLLVSGSQSQIIQVVDFEGHKLNQIQYHEGFLGQRIGPICCLAFHPFRTLLAAGATDSIVSVYTSSAKTKDTKQ